MNLKINCSHLICHRNKVRYSLTPALQWPRVAIKIQTRKLISKIQNSKAKVNFQSEKFKVENWILQSIIHGSQFSILWPHPLPSPLTFFSEEKTGADVSTLTFRGGWTQKCGRWVHARSTIQSYKHRWIFAAISSTYPATLWLMSILEYLCFLSNAALYFSARLLRLCTVSTCHITNLSLPEI